MGVNVLVKVHHGTSNRIKVMYFETSYAVYCVIVVFSVVRSFLNLYLHFVFVYLHCIHCVTFYLIFNFNSFYVRACDMLMPLVCTVKKLVSIIFRTLCILCIRYYN